MKLPAPPDIADELAWLQDRVAQFPSSVAIATIERAFKRPVGEVFERFDETPVASASIAQVHFATIRNARGRVRDVAVKVLRPGMRRVMEKDLALMAMMAALILTTHLALALIFGLYDLVKGDKT